MKWAMNKILYIHINRGYKQVSLWVLEANEELLPLGFAVSNVPYCFISIKEELVGNNKRQSFEHIFVCLNFKVSAEAPENKTSACNGIKKHNIIYTTTATQNTKTHIDSFFLKLIKQL